MLRYLPLLLIALTLTGCVSKKQGMPLNIETRELSHTILTYSEKLKYEKNLHLEDSVIYFDESVMRIRLDYSSMDIVYIWEARELLVDLVEEFLARINDNPWVYPPRAGIAFGPENLEVYIRFKSFYDTSVDLQTIGVISLRKGIAHYIASDAFDCHNDCWHIRSEYYDQSRDFVAFRREGEELYKPEGADKPSALRDDRLFSTDIGQSTLR
ncbi:MAG: hypothetical protein K940chlam7_00724 [Chlamydiae bacterium]|nr:hypothetical protein [Chlamydiota bacterium]